MDVGSRVKIVTDGVEHIGMVLQSPKDNLVLLKLDSGYNIAIKNDSITKSMVVKKGKARTLARPKIVHNELLPTISILHTGGTIASKVDYDTGAVISTFTPEDLVGMFPRLTSMANIRSRLMANMWSQDMRFEHYNIMAREVEKEVKAGSTGVIITHGTDTLHYSSAALAFILENCPVPVLLVGAQRSSDRGSTDAEMNLYNAVYFMTNSTFNGVAICMHENSNDENCLILPACKTRKMHSSRRDAFRAVNVSPFARVNYRSENIEELKKWHTTKGTLVVKEFDVTVKVGILFQRTHMFAEEFSFYSSYDGLVIESTGLGNLPIIKNDIHSLENEKIKIALETMIASGVIVVLSPQTIYGRLHGHVYENEVTQQEMGVIAHLSDMTTETTYIKLAWLLSNYPNRVKELLLKDMRGELTERIEENTFLA